MLLGARPNWPFKIIEEPNVTLLINQARTNYPRFDDTWEGIMWLLAYGGHKMGSPTELGGVGHRIYVDNGDAVAGFPRILIVYKVTVEAFVIKILRVSDPR